MAQIGRGPVDRNFLWNTFRQIDKNGDGHVNADELQVALKNGSWDAFNPETVRYMIGMFDADSSGTIDFSEFASLWQYVTDWSHAFRSYDIDRNGTIDLRELELGFRVSMRIINLLLRRFDRSATGNIRFDDFIQLCIVLRMLTEAFQRYDYTRTGNIEVTYEQFLTMVFAMRHGR